MPYFIWHSRCSLHFQTCLKLRGGMEVECATGEEVEENSGRLRKRPKTCATICDLYLLSSPRLSSLALVSTRRAFWRRLRWFSFRSRPSQVLNYTKRIPITRR